MNDLEKNKALAVQFLDALAAGETATVLSLVSDDLEYWIAGSLELSGTHDKAFLAHMLQMTAGVFDGKMVIVADGFTAEGNRVAVEARGTARTVSGRDYNNVYHYLFEFDDGKIIRLREYMDTGHVIAVLSD